MESGILGHWKRRRVDVTKMLPSVQPEKVEKLKYIFYFYAIGMTLATLVFIGEVLHHRYVHKDTLPNKIKEYYFDFKH